jgi:hypothetical protein
MSNERNEDQKERFVLDGYLTEDEVLDMFGVSKATLANLRYKQKLPFIETAKTSRLYPEVELKQWLSGRIKVLNKTISDTETTISDAD